MVIVKLTYIGGLLQQVHQADELMEVGMGEDCKVVVDQDFPRLMARNREDGETDVFVHDVDRVVEDKFSKAFLCEGSLGNKKAGLGIYHSKP
ncbi:Glucuronoxylan 4-O-methyltransferase 3 [Vitis vinifera]|uniref:Glucuronoxylan 4-O-methyltransferase 3 n=1 Tax=Vitis vinifera TaxID=29760 RepID=A0A438FJ36_VITVI|nr:Glucuronoxylan 4-O-methyltransferase 3 [Vitis vinifera]